jgi:hypothetical protein
MTRNRKECCRPATIKAGPTHLKRRDFIQRAALLAGGASVLGGTAIADTLAQNVSIPGNSGPDRAQLDEALQQAGSKSATGSKYASAIDRPYNGAYSSAMRVCPKPHPTRPPGSEVTCPKICTMD